MNTILSILVEVFTLLGGLAMFALAINKVMRRVDVLNSLPDKVGELTARIDLLETTIHEHSSILTTRRLPTDARTRNGRR